MSAALVVQRPDARVRVDHDAWVVTIHGEEVSRRPLPEVGRIVLFGAAELTSAARDAALKRGVDVTYLSERGTYLGRLVGRGSTMGDRRVAQLRAAADPARAVAIARTIVAGKLRNQRNLLLRVARERDDTIPAAVLTGMAVLIERTNAVTTLDEARGVEGMGARLYFQGLRRAVLNPELRFDGRSKRPPLDEINACLSFGYTLLLREVESAALATGLELYVGTLHAAGHGKPAVALDLMEELRPLVVDRTVLRLANRRQLTPADFEPGPDGVGVYLNERGRPVLLQELYAAMRRRVHYDDREGALTVRAIVRRQAERLAAAFEDPSLEYLPFVPR